MKKPRVALKYLKAALKMEKRNKETHSHELASTYMNLCDIYSELGFHSEAINKAIKSILLLKSYITSYLSNSNRSFSPSSTNELD